MKTLVDYAVRAVFLSVLIVVILVPMLWPIGTVMIPFSWFW